jgi:hypothetical protein
MHTLRLLREFRQCAGATHEPASECSQDSVICRPFKHKLACASLNRKGYVPAVQYDSNCET